LIAKIKELVSKLFLKRKSLSGKTKNSRFFISRQINRFGKIKLC
jgi:hypothetical protein